jgi:tRNA A-37 threonylcarbamoyl transferase component Bud32
MSNEGDLDVFCKIVNIFRSSDGISALNTEVCRYAALQNLQGVVVPRVCGYYDVWGLLKLLALEDVGTAIPEDASIDTEMRMQMKSALAHIHSAGYVLGDIARRDFCKRGNRIFLVDLETLTMGSTVEMEDELAAVDVS